MHLPLHVSAAGRGATVLALLLAATGCPVAGGGGTTGGTDFGTDSFGTDQGSGTDSPTTTTPTSTTTNTTTTPTTTTPTSSTTSLPTTDTEDTGETDPTGSTACLGSGTFTVSLVDRNDLYGHFPYLMLWYLPGEPEETTDEVLDVTVNPDGTLTISVLPRENAAGGHTGLAGLSGTITETCDVAIEGQVEFTSNTGPFGSITVTINGVLTPLDGGPAPLLSFTLEGGQIPSGPITYETEITAQN